MKEIEMRDNTFTPGPWYIDQDYLSEIQTADNKTICSAWHKYAANKEIIVTGVLECSLEESAANARLIASAPDLYNALWEAVEISDRNLTEAGRTPECQKVYDLCLAALKKAEGE